MCIDVHTYIYIYIYLKSNQHSVYTNMELSYSAKLSLHICLEFEQHHFGNMMTKICSFRSGAYSLSHDTSAVVQGSQRSVFES